MNFMKASSQLIAGVTLGDLAAELGVSATLLSQARFPVRSPSHRKPPVGWEAALAKLAQQRAVELTALADNLGTGKTTKRPKKAARRTSARTKRRR
jgi:hypothetical protein